MDSLMMAAGDKAARFNALTLLKVEQELFEVENQAKQEQLHHQKRLLLLYGIIILIVITAFLLVLSQYIRKRSAYQALVVKSREWAGIYESEKLSANSGSHSGNKNRDSIDGHSAGKTRVIPEEGDKIIMEGIEKTISEKKTIQTHRPLP